VTEIRSDIIHLPTGVAKEPARRLYGQRLLFDRTPALELAQGARITGLTWPAKYNGEWAFGWHDGVHATVPTDLLRLDTPPNQHIKIGGTSMIRARAKWKFNPGKDKSSDWLKIDKNDVIKNIACESLQFRWTLCIFGNTLLIILQGLTSTTGAGLAQTPRANGVSFPKPLSTLIHWKNRQV
jgi:hypothetical protein